MLTGIVAIVGTAVAVLSSVAAALLKMRRENDKPSATIRYEGRMYRVDASDAKEIVERSASAH